MTIAIAGGVQEMEQKAQTKHCSAKCEKGQGQKQSTTLGMVHHSGCVCEVSLAYRLGCSRNGGKYTY